MRRDTNIDKPLAVCERAHYWRDSQLPGLELLTATYVTHAFSRHTHDTYVFALIEQGAEAFNYNASGRYVAGAGSVGVIDPGVVHTGFAEQQPGGGWWRYRVFYPDVALLTEVARLAGWRGHDYPAFPAVIYDDPVLFHRMVRLHGALERSDLSRLEHDSRLMMTLGAFAARFAVSGKSDPAYIPPEPRAADRARAYLQSHPTENVSLATLSEIAGVSPFHLVRSFKEAWGMPPHQFQIVRRVEMARRLLLSGHRPAQAAVASGFTDQSHLTRHFRSIVGVNPGSFLERR